MNQKQRLNDKQKTKVKVTLKAKEIELKDRKIDLEPLIDELERDVFTKIANSVMELMGIPCLPKQIEVRLFDENEYRKALKEMGCEELGGQVTGFYIWGRKDVIINYERGAKQMVECGLEPEEAVVNALIIISAHELTHLNQHFYSPGIMESRDEAIKEYHSNRPMANDLMALYEKGETQTIRGVIANLKALPMIKSAFKMFKYGGLTEGIAKWMENEILEQYTSYSIEWTGKIDTDPFKRIELSSDDEYSFGYNFVKKVAESTDKNPVKLIMDHHPTYLEMLYPQLYILRMKAALLI